MTGARCDLYQNPYKTHCSGSISPDDGVSICWRHLQANRDWWMRRALDLLRDVSSARPASQPEGKTWPANAPYEREVLEIKGLTGRDYMTINQEDKAGWQATPSRDQVKAQLLGPCCCIECRTVMDGWPLIFVVAHIAACWPGARGSECG